MKKKLITMTAVMALAASTLAGCGGSKPAADSNSGASGDNVIKIASQTPLSGSSAVLGEAIKLGAQLAIEEEKENFTKLGFDLQLAPFDDQGDPKKGVANAELIGADKSILGVMGHLNSGVAIPASEKYEQYNIPMVSPANTANVITDRKLKTVNRIVARDENQGAAAAEYAIGELKAKNVFVMQDKTAYGQGLADAFRAAAEKGGAKIAGYEGITAGEKDFNGVLNKVLATKPDFIFFGGLYPEGGLIVKQARAKGITVPFMGGDGLDSSQMVEIAGEGITNTFYSSVADDVTKTDAGKKWADTYKQKFNKNPESYSFYGYDSAKVILKGIENAIKANGNKKPSREQVRDAVRAIKDYQGIATKVSFDEIGDNTFAKVFVFKFEGQKYPGTQVKSIEVK